MQKNYIAPQIEVIQLSSTTIMDSIAIVHHSGGNDNGQSGFTEENQIW